MKDDEWISAAESLKRVSAVMDHYSAVRAICSRAHAGLIDAKAARFTVDSRSGDNMPVPKGFWWAGGEAALDQNWSSGDFETWIDRKVHLKAFGVMFARAGVESLVAPAGALTPTRTEKPLDKEPAGGRPAAAWWDDLWVEMARALYAGDLQPRKQSDIESAMMDWAIKHGHNPGETTIRERARKLWAALKKEDGN